MLLLSPKRAVAFWFKLNMERTNKTDGSKLGNTVFFSHRGFFLFLHSSFLGLIFFTSFVFLQSIYE